ncbi:hypothetical protein GIB67_030394 [Kingdonia uniflora]|uniref:MADS-box domain-containing protein n=1 Tax=Kingdonia uniflora TaxID=39325 RepID=A0A7J7NE12_9MAGN|nr:hypothetical protein GIB67_030394 [Kingdonia uniflora]
MGRHKIPIEHINEKSKKQVTFSKRRQGIFSKATELSKLTGADIAIITFSPGGRPFTFSNKPVESVVHRYLSQDHYNIPPLVNTGSISEEERLVRQYMDEIRVLEEVKKREKEIQKAKRMRKEGSGFWWEAEISCETSLVELEKIRDAMLEVKSKIDKRVEKMSTIDDCLWDDVEFIDDGYNWDEHSWLN